MRFRKLRIAWSVLWAILCLLLLALWWRSYWWKEYAFRPISSQNVVSFSSYKGQAHAGIGRLRLGSYVQKRDGSYVKVHASGWQLGGEGASGRDPNYRLAFRLQPYLSVETPHCLLVLASITAAVAPWIHWSKRFTLRTLLIATTLLAMVLGLIVWATRN
jgi:hypothetical protein